MHSKSFHAIIPAHVIVPFFILALCFSMWGLANNMTDVLVAQFKKIYSLSDLQSSLVQIAFYSAYFCLALPSAFYIRRYSFKSGVLLGLGIFATGAFLFYPSAHTQEYNHFLISLFILASGLSILETSANAYVLMMGPANTATCRLNLAQAFNPIGSIIGVLVGKYVILVGLNPASESLRNRLSTSALQQIQTEEIAAVLGPYLIVAILIVLIWITIALFPMPVIEHKKTTVLLDSNHDPHAARHAAARLWSDRLFIRGVLGQFLYMGCQIGCWSFTIRYIMNQIGGNEFQASDFLLASIICFSIGRFVCTALMTIFSPASVLGVMASIASVLCCLTIFKGGHMGAYSLVGMSGCMSLMFPTLYGMSMQNLEKHDISLGGSCMIMAIIGGAVLTPVIGFVSDISNIQTAFVIPFIGFMYLVWFCHSVKTGRFS